MVQAKQNHNGLRLIAALRDLRAQTGLTINEVRVRAGITQRKMHRLEECQLPTLDELHTLLDIYHVALGDRGRYYQLRHGADGPMWWAPTTHGADNCRYYAAEDDATTITEFALATVPELLQTIDYTRTATTGLPTPVTPKSRQAAIARRQIRILDPNRHAQLHIILHEPLLRQGIGAMQRSRLIGCAHEPRITLQVLPQDRGLHAGLAGPMIHLDFTDPPGEAYTRDALGDYAQLHDADRIRKALEHLAAIALPPEASLALILRSRP
ncbi:helix-turn-helix domain-containing protein [Actinocrispum wychmicini]|uniref:Helix-turn-helix protein n=1 Tax=Actinocrispum wychmicini TaxID=1213861 RepID=A0A4R2IV62_9PSEU|nr:helix-turn-helix transcriptional regulator [Actinocrispum wychmicini]TCO47998.1 helix-turn-helix protein [Actinocrispum wychmicini]